MSGRLCVIGGCRQLGSHADDCDSDRCKGCQPRACENPMVCNSCRTGLAAELADIPTLYAELVEEPDPVDHTTWTVRQWRPIPTADPARRLPWAWVGEAGDERLARLLPMGIVRNGQGAKVSGSKNPPVPVGLDRLDLAAGAKPGGLTAEAAKHPADQIGHQSAATILDSWVREWREVLFPDQHLPVPTVAQLAGWLATRLRDACDKHLGIDEFATEIRRLRTALRRALELDAAPRERCEGVACRSCDRISLFRDSGLVTCGYCGLNYSEHEYRDWVALLKADTRHRIKQGELPMPETAELRRLVA